MKKYKLKCFLDEIKHFEIKKIKVIIVLSKDKEVIIIRLPDESKLLINVPHKINYGYHIADWRHAATIIQYDFPEQWSDLINCLENFSLKKSSILTAGGRKSPVANELDSFLYDKGWKEKKFDVDIQIDGRPYDIPTHKLDCVMGKIGLEIEWNNKDPFYDRDLTNFRILYDYGVIDVGIIITRHSGLQKIFNTLGKGSSYGTSTTHYDKLKHRIEGNGSGGCPILVFAITDKLYEPNL